MGGSWLCRYSFPRRIRWPQFLMAFNSTCLCVFLYCLRFPEVKISVIMLIFSSSTQEWRNLMMFPCLKRLQQIDLIEQPPEIGGAMREVIYANLIPRDLYTENFIKRLVD
ncbi:hypothetical protein MLD38_013048 [Melastoma candidum]|uniref:Uncharacterized protein n=1 Tax=Melastoma candidum TaxID=119954 RepID=A0ACB9R9G0_9MYRT|nr:hypothetical protein MLD38_013048 [Melastoma candidum]